MLWGAGQQQPCKTGYLANKLIVALESLCCWSNDGGKACVALMAAGLKL